MGVGLTVGTLVVGFCVERGLGRAEGAVGLGVGSTVGRVGTGLGFAEGLTNGIDKLPGCKVGWPLGCAVGLALG